MPHFTIPFDKVSALSTRDIAYQLHPDQFSDFYAYSPDLMGLKKAIESRSKTNVDRDLLVKTLQDQAKSIVLSEAQIGNIENLANANTYTVITAHQPSLMTGPAYFVIKALSTINLAQNLTKEAQNTKIVPVFIIGSEDHDFEEVNHFNIFNKTITWESNQKGPVGRMNLEGLDEVISQFNDVLGESINATYIKELIAYAKLDSYTYNEFVYKFVNKLFANYGLIVANMDDVNLKRHFSQYMVKEVVERKSESLIKTTQDQLEKLGFSSQAYPREINLFYMTPGARERIVHEGDQFEVLNSEISWNESEIVNEITTHPERFSPNVVMRPLYQEVIWPNIAYIGGGGELAYWLERKSQFEYFGVHFPVLIRRNSLVMVNKSQVNHIEKLGFELKDLFEEEHILISRYLDSKTSFDLDLSAEIQAFETLFAGITDKASQADKSLEGFAEAEKTRMIKQLEQIESRIKRSVKKQEEVSVNQIQNLKSKLFPNNGLQERHDNFFQFFLSKGPEIFDELIPILDPLEKEFVVTFDE